MDNILVSEVSGDLRTDTYWNPEEQKVTVHRQQETKPYLERAKKLREEWNGKSDGGNYYYAGSFPVVVVEKYCREKGITWEHWVKEGHKAMLNDPDYKNLRIWQGRV